MAESLPVVFPSTTVALNIISARTGVAVFSLEENGRYEYEVLSPDHVLLERSGVIRRSRMKGRENSGTIEPGSYVGLLKLELCSLTNDKVVLSNTQIQVLSKKLKYESEYRAMLEDIADRCVDFLLQLESPVDVDLIPDNTEDEATLAQRLYFLKGLLGGEDFQLALQRIIAMPNTQWQEKVRSVDVRQSRRLGRHEVKQFASAGRRIKVPVGHPLRNTVSTIPERIEVRDKNDTVDTPENRFVKHALSVFLQTLEDLVSRLPGNKKSDYPGLKIEIGELIDDLDETLSHDVFKAISRPELLALNSPVLQRKEGYRQVLRAWMMFDLAARLSWDGGDDVYKGGNRDAAALYEYWVFFKMLDLVSAMFILKRHPVEDLINKDDLVWKLKAGSHLPIDGSYSKGSRKLSVRFSYNRTFSVVDTYPASGSWTRQMRPDYTLSLWPAEFESEEAEVQELITHIHFDAKYKVDSLAKLFGNKNENSDEEESYDENPVRAGNYKRADLLKMHAYRDAIRRSAGAYVLYPGNEKAQSPFQGFHELLPGLGAFPLRPNTIDDGTDAIKGFVKAVVEQICDRATQHERHTYHTYQIHKDNPPDAVREELPEKETGTQERGSVPSEASVLVGFYKDQVHLNWILQGREKLYNCRADVGRGSLRLEAKLANASYVLLHTTGEMNTNKIYRVVKRGPRVLAAETLISKGYPHPPSRLFYLVYEIEPLENDNPLCGRIWRVADIPGWAPGRSSAIPFGVTLADLMKAAEPSI